MKSSQSANFASIYSSLTQHRTLSWALACGEELIIKLIYLINTGDYFYLKFLIKVLNKKTSFSSYRFCVEVWGYFQRGNLKL